MSTRKRHERNQYHIDALFKKSNLDMEQLKLILQQLLNNKS
jgi:hypothetical protein